MTLVYARIAQHGNETIEQLARASRIRTIKISILGSVNSTT